MKTTILALIFISIFAISCEDSSTNYYPSSNSFFPMNVGNEWVYVFEDERIDNIVTVTSINTINGLDYYQFVTDFSSRMDNDTQYFRADAAGDIFEYIPEFDSTYPFGRVFLHFSKTKPDSVTWSAGNVTREGFKDTVAAGIFENCTEVVFHPYSQWPAYKTYVRNIGLIRSSYIFGLPSLTLKSAKINGVEIP